jgi:hypothetical protein
MKAEQGRPGTTGHPGPPARHVLAGAGARIRDALLERHVRRVLLACKADGGAKGLGDEFERQLPGQVMPAPAARGALPQ